MIRNRNRQRQTNRTIYICCQGKATEKLYFEYFKNKYLIVSIKIVAEHKTDALQFIEYIIKNYKNEINDYDEFWAVFDKDETVDNDFNSAISKASKGKINTAYSIQSFEVWLINHFEIIEAKLSRKQYDEKLSECLKFKYSHDAKSIYQAMPILSENIDDAIKNSEKQYKKYNHQNPAKEEPITTVFMLAKKFKEIFNN